jgi:hypothetical protein
MTATVEPRKVAAGEAVSVVARLEGVGNVPSDLSVPQQKGVEWLEPTLRGEVEPSGETVKGYRTFTYVVKLNEPGVVKLGELNLPFWDPRARAYHMARADLGEVTVTAALGAAKAKAPDAPNTPLAEVGKPRTALGAEVLPKKPATEEPWFLWLLFGAPLGVVLADGSVRLGSRLRQHWASQKNDPRVLAMQALSTARDHVAHAPEAAHHGERALFFAIEAATGIRARALVKDQLSRALAESKIGSDLESECARVLEACETARFTPETDQAGRDLLRSVEHVVRGLLRHKRS